jgi:hypothetical protein
MMAIFILYVVVSLVVASIASPAYFSLRENKHVAEYFIIPILIFFGWWILLGILVYEFRNA